MRKEETGLLRMHLVIWFTMLVLYGIGWVDNERFKTALLAYIATMVASIYFKIQPNEKKNISDTGENGGHASSSD